MDTGDYLYMLFMVAMIILSIVGNMRKAQKKKNKQQQFPPSQAQQQQFPPLSTFGEPLSTQNSYDDWFNRDDDNAKYGSATPPPVANSGANPFTILLEQLHDGMNRNNDKPKKKAAKKKSSKPSKKKNYVIEPPEQEGKRATANVATSIANDAYATTNDCLPHDSKEWRKAIIAHEILKRKF